MNNITNKNIEWSDEQLPRMVEQLVKTISKEVKEEIWYKYTLCFKKDKKGVVLIRNPKATEL